MHITHVTTKQVSDSNWSKQQSRSYDDGLFLIEIDLFASKNAKYVLVFYLDSLMD